MSELFIMAKQLIKGHTRSNPRAFRNPILSQKKRQHFFPRSLAVYSFPLVSARRNFEVTLLAPTDFSRQPNPEREAHENSWAWKRDAARLGCVHVCSLARQSREGCRKKQ